MASRVIPSVYRHTQSSPSTLWTVNHNLGGGGGTGIPIVDVVADNNGSTVKVMPLQINVVDKNTVTIEFSVAQSGTAVVVA